MHPSTWNLSSISHQTKTRIHIPYQEPPSSLTYYSHSSSSCHQIDSFLKLIWYQHIISESWIWLIASFLPSPHCQLLLVLQDVLLSAQSRTLHYSSSFHISPHWPSTANCSPTHLHYYLFHLTFFLGSCNLKWPTSPHCCHYLPTSLHKKCHPAWPLMLYLMLWI